MITKLIDELYLKNICRSVKKFKNVNSLYTNVLITVS